MMGKFTGKPYIWCKNMVSCRFSLNPIHWYIGAMPVTLQRPRDAQRFSWPSSHAVARVGFRRPFRHGERCAHAFLGLWEENPTRFTRYSIHVGMEMGWIAMGSKYCWEPDPSGGCIMLYLHAAHDFLFDFHVLVWITPRPWRAGGPEGLSLRGVFVERKINANSQTGGGGWERLPTVSTAGEFRTCFRFGETNPRRCSNSIETKIWESTIRGC